MIEISGSDYYGAGEEIDAVIDAIAEDGISGEESA
jgi:hypothetical protein